MTSSRRSFLVSAGAAAGAARVLGANDRVRVGIIGAGGRGSYLMGQLNKCPNTQWAAVCDAWDLRLDKATELSGPHVDKYSDYRKMLERKDLDGVIIATWDV